MKQKRPTKRFIVHVILFGFTVVCLSSNAYAQRVQWGVAGTTEGLWNISDGKTGWCNLLEASITAGLWKNGRVEVAAISTYNYGTPVAEDFQVLTNIDAGPDKAFRLIQAGFGQDFGPWGTVYLGLRNIDVDHFTTPFTGLFTNSSHGNFPILSANFPVATYPMAALSLYAEFRPFKGMILRESVYNGVASDRLDEQFRFRPGRDGVFNIGSLSYHLGEEEEEHHGHYTLGYALGTQPGEGSDDLAYNYALWALMEQPFLHVGKSHLGALLQGGTSPATRSACRYYYGAGLIWGGITKNDFQMGVVVNRALYSYGRETDVELTGSFPICKYFTLQPAVHCINTNGNYIATAQLRAIVEIGN